MNGNRERLFELLALRATEGLAPAEGTEVADLLRQNPTVEADGFDRAAAAIHLALTGSEHALPGGLEAKILADWQASRAEESSSERRESKPVPIAWWLAAAALAIAIAGWWPRLTQSPPAAAPAESVAKQAVVETEAPLSDRARREALAKEPDSLVLPWSATEDAAAAAASGDVVWSPRQQTGYMRIAGLEANNPSVSQYQLWIFDRQRDERYPVDGGVFDIPADGGEAVIPINAKIEVGESYLFAVTVEPPGGVVVSDRERIVLLAQG